MANSCHRLTFEISIYISLVNKHLNNFRYFSIFMYHFSIDYLSYTNQTMFVIIRYSSHLII